MAHKWDPICPPPRRLVRPVPRDALGVAGPTPGQAKGPGWRSTSYGFHVPSTVDSTVPEQRILEQSVRLPAGGAVTGWAGLRMRRAGFFDGLAPDGRTQFPVPLAVGRGSKIRGDDKVALSREPLEHVRVELIRGVPCVEVSRSLFDEMRRLRDLREAVVAMDMAAAALLTSIRRMREFWKGHRSWRRASLVAQALDLASEDSRSPQETRVRLIWVLDACLPVPLVNQPIWDLDGNLLGIADLLDEEAGLVVEFDGADHRSATRHTRDVQRQYGFERHGLQVVRVTGLDVPQRARVRDRILFHRERALWLPPERRTWTLLAPPGREPDQTLDEYLEERAWHMELHRQAERLGLM